MKIISAVNYYKV